MNSKVNPSRVFLVLLFIVHCSCSNAFNITEILSQHPDFSSFSDALSQTQVASAINSRQTLTVLALDNDAMSGVPSSLDTRRAVMNLHVVLDYFDPAKLQNMPKKSTILTTLYQTTGLANGMQGFLNVTIMNNGIMIGSAVPGSNLGSSLVKAIASQPYNISVLQVSGAIIPPDFGGHTNSSSSPPSPPPPGGSSPPSLSPKPSPIIPLPPKFGNAPVPSASPPHSGTTPPPGTGVLPPSGTGATPPSGTGATPPSATGATPPTDTGATPPSGTGATPPSGTGATSPAGATAPSDAAATTPTDAMTPSEAAANSPAGALPVVPGNAPTGSPPKPAGAGTIADSPLADAPAGGNSASGRSSYHSLDLASILMMSFVVIWSLALSI